MAQIIRTKPGPVVAQDGTYPELRGARKGGLVSQDVAGRYEELVYRGNTYTVANTAAQALTLGVAAATGLILTNPLSSKVNLCLLEVCIALQSLPAGAAGLALWANPIAAAQAAYTYTTKITPVNALIGSTNASAAVAGSSITLPVAPTLVRAIGGGPAATVAASTAFPPFIKDEVAGAIIVAPGCAISLQSVTTAISVIASFTWEEIPL